MDRELTGTPDRIFLRSCFHKLLLNFTWWVNRKDAAGRNIFAGGFLGLDNITIFDRSHPLPTGGTIDQSDGTAWMAMFTLNLLRIALELALEDRAYEPLATKFFEHFLCIAQAMTHAGGIGLWDEQDQFYYDVLRLPEGGGDPAAGALGRGPDPAVRGGGDRPPGDQRAAGVSRADAVHAAAPPRPRVADLPLDRGGRGRAAPALAAARPPGQAAAAAHVGRGGVPVAPRRAGAVQGAQGPPLRAGAWRRAVQHRLRAGRGSDNRVRRQLQLAGAGADADQHPADRQPARVPPLLRRGFPGGVPDGQRQLLLAGGGRGHAEPSAHRAVPEGRGREAAGAWG